MAAIPEFSFINRGGTADRKNGCDITDIIFCAREVPACAEKRKKKKVKGREGRWASATSPRSLSFPLFQPAGGSVSLMHILEYDIRTAASTVSVYGYKVDVAAVLPSHFLPSFLTPSFRFSSNFLLSFSLSFSLHHFQFTPRCFSRQRVSRAIRK